MAEQSVTDMLRWRLMVALSALENWGKHHPWCGIVEDPQWVCNCGLLQQIEDIKKVLR